MQNSWISYCKQKANSNRSVRTVKKLAEKLHWNQKSGARTVKLHSFVDSSRSRALDANLIWIVDFDEERTSHDRLTIVQYLHRMST